LGVPNLGFVSNRTSGPAVKPFLVRRFSLTSVRFFFLFGLVPPPPFYMLPRLRSSPTDTLLSCAFLRLDSELGNRPLRHDRFVLPPKFFFFCSPVSLFTASSPSQYRHRIRSASSFILLIRLFCKALVPASSLWLQFPLACLRSFLFRDDFVFITVFGHRQASTRLSPRSLPPYLFPTSFFQPRWKRSSLRPPPLLFLLSFFCISCFWRPP